ncbi:hypothetical protein [Pseudohoeflea coraliihabitans]|uniref:Nif11 domain-containing protein n=1 Tax=Pseudohoeflea coraliihabitans TaxID=2860393 RepID=A0ABS6WL63_9HYPH|nr:hypothetical protein [Pseudohoeflea sp. DP4N28-3]MBW3096677.1 hypothetical protein [Pseudohoeflea sp. DP4N28-3]
MHRDPTTFLDRMLSGTPTDVRLLAQRFRDHAIEPRCSIEETRELVADLGYESIEAFCAAAGLPAHLAARWERFGASGSVRQLLLMMRSQREAVAAAVEDFESSTHVGLDDFMRERGII